MAIEIKEGVPSDPRVVQLISIHVSKAQAQTAPGSAHALDLGGLASPDIRFWTAWEGESVVGTVALKRLSQSHGEIKSMHTAEAFRRRGVGGTLLRHVILEARSMGLHRLSLESGSWVYFTAAHKLYAKHGFVPCEPFGDYVPDRNSVFMTLELETAEPK